MTAATGRPTHATAPAVLRDGVMPDITAGKTYEIVDFWAIHDHRYGHAFRIRSDNGRLATCLERDSAELCGGDWLLTTEPPPEDQSATIARLERRVAVLREALEQADEWLSGWASAEPYRGIIAAALADTEEQK